VLVRPANRSDHRAAAASERAGGEPKATQDMTDAHFQDLDATLRDGRSVHIRSMRPDDEAELLQMFERTSAQARYMRFMRPVREPNLDRVRRLLVSFPGEGQGLVATVPAADGIDIVGSAMFIVLPDRQRCEFATTVGAAFAGAGLARTLMSLLIDAARRRGLKEMEGFVLAENQSMLGLARRLGFTITTDPDDRALRICRLPLGGS
jgi:acetyltransferase